MFVDIRLRHGMDRDRSRPERRVTAPLVPRRPPHLLSSGSAAPRRLARVTDGSRFRAACPVPLLT